MKKQLTVLCISVLLFSSITFSGFTYQEKNKNNKKDQQQNKMKNQEKPGKANAGNKNNQDAGKAHKQNQELDNAKGNKSIKDDNDKKGKKNDVHRTNKGNNDMKDGYEWDRATFKERKNIKKQEKVTVCHKFNSNNEPAVTIRVSSNALKAHMNHGDVMGDCPAESSSRFSDIFIRRRADYYNSLQESQEQVLYSRSILDYALERLAGSRLQLAALQNNNMPLADIERKQKTVVELEQNVSLLETLIGAATTLLANKLQ